MRSLKISIASIIAALVLTLFGPPGADAATNHLYNGITAATYADRYSCDGVKCYNHSFRYLTDDGTNFISQVIGAGGYRSTALWRPYSLDWSYVVNLYVVFKGWGWLTVGSQYSGGGLAAAYTSANRGDLLMYDWGKGKSFSHLSVVTGWGARSPHYSRDGQGDYMDQHTNDRYHAPWNYGYLHPDSNTDRAHMRVWVLKPTHQLA
jgi:hypothetical protein